MTTPPGAPKRAAEELVRRWLGLFMPSEQAVPETLVLVLITRVTDALAQAVQVDRETWGRDHPGCLVAILKAEQAVQAEREIAEAVVRQSNTLLEALTRIALRARPAEPTLKEKAMRLDPYWRSVDPAEPAGEK